MIIQRGELTEVLRDFFNVAGRARISLDEAIFGTVSLAALDQPPHRREARTFAQRVSHSAVAGELSGAGILLPTGAAGGARLRGILLENGTAAAHQMVLVYSVRAESLPTFTLAGGFCDTERPGESGTSLRLTPLRGFTSDDAALPGVNFEQRVGLCPLAANSSFYFPLDIMLYPNVGLAVYCNTANTALGASFYGEYFPEASNSR